MKESKELVIEIKGLFGYKNLVINLDKDVKIFIGENGTGKTTILNILYYILKGNYDGLRDINFNSIILKNANKNIEVNKEWLIETNNLNIKELHRRRRQVKLEDENKSITDFYESYIRLSGFLDEVTFKKFINEVTYGEKEVNEFLVEENLRFNANSPNRLHIIYKKDMKKLSDPEAVTFLENKNSIDEFVNLIQHYMNDIELKYFPTYRRIEEDLSKLGLGKPKKRFEDSEMIEVNNLVKSNEEIIQFGMKDVEALFKEMKNKISDNSLKSYSNVTGSMIKQLVSFGVDIDVRKMVTHINENIKELEIVLKRVLTQSEVNNIIELVINDSIFSDEHKHLIYFLYNLIVNYNEYKEYDDSIKSFCKACNQYLVDKRFIYNEVKIDIYITNDYSKEVVGLNQLSSGEKQIVSILSKIYFSSKEMMILFDEPELSLSIEWQEMLLPHIMESKKCRQLIAVTHSPFIFNNEFENNVSTIIEVSEV